MDPCPFVRILVGNLSIKSELSSKPSSSGKVHPSSSPYYCEIKLKGITIDSSSSSSSTTPSHSATVPLIVSSSSSDTNPNNSSSSLAAHFDFPKSVVIPQNPITINISVYKSRTNPTCAFNSSKLVGKISIPLDISTAESRPCTFHNGWVPLTRKNNTNSQLLLHLTLRAEPDPRFVFRFDGEPECSPQVFQVRGDHVKQPVFTCKFSFRDRNNHNQGQFNSSTTINKTTTTSQHEDEIRKGWSITIHDLSGSPVACASMVTPFVPSPGGSQRVSRSNPGAWLIIKPDGDGTWKPWGRLEAWRENGISNSVGYRFDVLPATADPVTLAGCTMSCHHGGKFTIDCTSGVTPVSTPKGSWDLGSGSGSGSGSDFGFEHQFLYKGFVMSASLDGERKCSKPQVEVGVKHVNCAEDAAAFVALAAAMDLSMDACKLFSQKLRKELRQ